jgi:hypothetical protein
VRVLGAFRPLGSWSLESVEEPLDPEFMDPVAAPPREPLSLECEHPVNASAPTTIGIAHSLYFIRHLLILSLSPENAIDQSEKKPPRRKTCGRS